MAFSLTGAMLRELFPDAREGYLNAIVNGGRLFDIAGVNTPLRMAHFLAQCAAETGGFATAGENGNYSAERLLEIFPHHFTPAQARAYAHKPSMILSRAYANRMGNGGELSRDGWRYRGRGIIQLTGRDNYAHHSSDSLDLLGDPDKAAVPAVSLKIALQEWSDLGLNRWADAGPTAEAVLACARGVNLGSPVSGRQPNGLAARRAWFAKIWALLGEGAPAKVNPVADGILEEGEEGRAVWELQEALAGLGYPVGAIDGIFGERTKAAVIVFQQRESLFGEPGKWRIAEYNRALPVATPFDMEDRAQTTPHGLVNTGDGQAADLSLGKRIAGAAGATSAAAGAIGSADPATLTSWTTVITDARGIAEPVVNAVQWAAHSAWIAAALACAAAYVLFQRAQARHTGAVQQGRSTP